MVLKNPKSSQKCSYYFLFYLILGFWFVVNVECWRRVAENLESRTGTTSFPCQNQVPRQKGLSLAPIWVERSTRNISTFKVNWNKFRRRHLYYINNKCHRSVHAEHGHFWSAEKTLIPRLLSHHSLLWSKLGALGAMCTSTLMASFCDQVKRIRTPSIISQSYLKNLNKRNSVTNFCRTYLPAEEPYNWLGWKYRSFHRSNQAPYPSHFLPVYVARSVQNRLNQIPS